MEWSPMNRNELDPRPCALCGLGRGKRWFRASDFDSGKEPFDLVQCDHCRAAWINPMPSEQELARYYESAYYGMGAEKFHPVVESLTRWAGRHRATELLKLAPKSSIRTRVLDIGCGRGNLLRSLAELGCECHGVEREDFPVAGNDSTIDYHLGPLTESTFMADSFDLVIIWHVLEHLYDPAETLERVKHWLKPGGALVVAVPNIGSRQARWFGASWFHLDVPRHLWHFSSESLDGRWRALGFEKVKDSGVSLEQNPYGFIQSVANRLLPGSPNALYRAIKSKSWLRLLLWSPFVALLLPLALLESVASARASHGATIMHAVRKPA
jgi:SAM-dependent methyltransferase